MNPELEKLEKRLGPGEFMRLMSRLERSRPPPDQAAQDQRYLDDFLANPSLYQQAPWAKPQEEAYSRKPNPTEALAEQISSVFKNMGVPDKRAEKIARETRELIDLTPLGWLPNSSYAMGGDLARGDYGSAAVNAAFAGLGGLAAKISPLTGITTKGFRDLMSMGAKRTPQAKLDRWHGLTEAAKDQQKLRASQEAAGFSRLPRQEVGAAMPQGQVAKTNPLGRLAAGTATGAVAMLPDEAEAGGMKNIVTKAGDALIKALGRGGSYVPTVRNQRSTTALSEISRMAPLDGNRWSKAEIEAAKVLRDEMGYDPQAIASAIRSHKGTE